MGNSFRCFSTKSAIPEPESESEPEPESSPPKEPPPAPWISPLANLRKSRKQVPPSAPSKMEAFDDSYIKEQAQIASMLYLQHLQKNGGDLIFPLERSVSVNHQLNSPKKQKQMSIRSRSCSTSVSSSLQLAQNQETVRSEGDESNHFVLVHGGGFGAWCWYKIIALLKETKCEVDAIDLTGSGANFCDINSIKTLAEFAKPLTDFLGKLHHNKKVILVGHDLGGACISLAMEIHSNKVAKAIFLAAPMLKDGQRALDIFSQQGLSDLNRRAQKLVYADGKDNQPTAIDFDKSLLEDFLFNKTTSKDIALASVSMRNVPFAPVMEKLSLSASKYGSIPRFYIKTEQDMAIPEDLQDAMIQANPPKQVFELKGSDHSPFFSRPQALHRILLEISKLTPQI